MRAIDVNLPLAGTANRRRLWTVLMAVLAAVGVLGTGSAWPDLLVACGMALLALSGGISVIRQARNEIKHAPSA